MTPEALTRLRRNLDAATDDALVALANRGLVRRAAKDLEQAGELTVDEVAYINAFLDINTVRQGDVTYSNIDYSSFSYDRSDVYGNVTVTVLIQQPDGSWVPTEVNVYDAVFGNVDSSGSGSLSTFAQAAEDARAVIEYIHEYALPADQGN